MGSEEPTGASILSECSGIRYRDGEVARKRTQSWDSLWMKQHEPGLLQSGNITFYVIQTFTYVQGENASLCYCPVTSSFKMYVGKETENILGFARVRGLGVGEMGDGGQKRPTSSYNVNKS